MASGANPILSGIFRALQIRSMLENQRRYQQQEQRMQETQAAREARQQQIDLLGAQEKVRTLSEQLEQKGIRLRPENVGRFEQAIAEGGGEADESIELAPGFATTRSSGRLEQGNGNTYWLPKPADVERAEFETGLDRELKKKAAIGEQDLGLGLDRLRQETALQRELAPVATIGGLETDESGNVFAVERDPRTRELTPRQVPGLKKRLAPERPEITPSERRLLRGEQRAVVGEERKERQISEANRLVNKYGSPEKALKALAREAHQNEFLRLNRVQVMGILRSGAERPGQVSPADKLRVSLRAAGLSEEEIAQLAGAPDEEEADQPAGFGRGDAAAAEAARFLEETYGVRPR